jgi:threonine synthase
MVDLRHFFLYMNEGTTYPELVAAVAPALLQGELNPFAAGRAAESAFDFEPELIRLDEQYSILSLCQGPTGVFKDFGIAFLAACLEELVKGEGGCVGAGAPALAPALALSAVRGDTGVSMARAFAGRQGLIPVMLYPEGPIRGLDPADFVPAGGTIIPIQVKGSFDDCQRLVLETLRDRDFADRYAVTSANAINIGRLLPQAFYYLYAFIKIKARVKGDIVFSVPSGNLGNLMAGLYAWKAGLPVHGFIAAMNANGRAHRLLRGASAAPGEGADIEPGAEQPLVHTHSPALDVRFPSNSERLRAFCGEAPAVLRNMVFPETIDNDATLAAMRYAWERCGELLDPHSAVAFAAARRFAESPQYKGHVHVVSLATGHPAKEAALVESVTGERVPLPERLACLRKTAAPIALIEPELDALEGAIASCF